MSGEQPIPEEVKAEMQEGEEIKFSPEVTSFLEECAVLNETERKWNAPRPFYDIDKLEARARELEGLGVEELRELFDRLDGELEESWGSDAEDYRNTSAQMDMILLRAHELEAQK